MTSEERAAWLAERRKGLGSSDAAAVLGMSPFKSAFAVWLDKMGKAETPETDAMAWGNMMEGGIAELYMRREGRRMVKITRTIPHPEYPEIRCTPDFMDEDDKSAPILEVKYAPYSKDEWGAEGTDEIPKHYLIQCVVQMEVCNRDICDVAVSFGKPEISVYRIARDRELGEKIVNLLRVWWKKHVVDGIQPAVDGSEAAKTYLTRLYAKPRKEVKKAFANEDAAMEELAGIVGQIDLLTDRAEKIKNELRAFMGEDEICDGEKYRVVWSAVKGRTVTDWMAAIAMLFLHHPEIEKETKEYLKSFTLQGEGTRRFQLKLKGGK